MFSLPSRPSRSPVLSLIAVLGFGIYLTGMASCHPPGESDDAQEVDEPPLPEGELTSEACEEPITGDVLPTPEVTEDTGIADYGFSVHGTRLDVDLVDASDQSLGRLETDLDLEFDLTTGRLQEWSVETHLREGNDTPASQILRGRELGEQRIWFEITHRAGDTELIQWTIVDDDGEQLSTTVGFDVGSEADPDVEGRIEYTDRLFDTLDVVSEGEQIAPAELQSWLDDRVGEAFEQSDAWRRLVATSNDTALLSGADAHVRLCQVAGTEADEDEITEQRQGLCPHADDDVTTQKQPNCPMPEPRDWLDLALAIDGTAGHIGHGKAATSALVAVGAISTGPAIAATFAGAIVASVMVENAIEDYVDENSDAVFDALGAAGEIGAEWGGHSGADGEAMANFFKGDSSGDPHYDTFDGLTYDFHGAGEFTLVESTDGTPLEVQVRQEPVEGNCPDVGVNTAAAAQVDDVRVSVYADAEEALLLVDGEEPALPGGVLALPGGATIEQAADPADDSYELHWPGGDRVQVTSRTWSDNALLDVSPEIHESRAGKVQGLLGNSNGNPDDDIRPRGEDPIGEPVRWFRLQEFGESWRVDAEHSLFDYFDGEDWSTFVDEGFPERPTLLDDLPEDERQDAREACEDAGIDDETILRGCVIDVVCTGSAELIDSHVDRESEADLEVTTPIFLDDWTHEGDTSESNWEVSDDGRTVVQTLNGAPTFFVSDEEHHDVTITGTFRVENDWDDDFIGFVFGYQSPLAEQGDDETDFDTFIFSWKAYDQETSGGSFGPEGFVLSHLQGELSSSNQSDLLWDHQETEEHRILDTHFEHGRGWRYNTDYPFELTYTEDEIVIVVGGEEIFRIDADDSPRPFVSGRFGFYNYSQKDVYYSDFDAVDAVDDPTASLEGLETGVNRPGDDLDEFEMDVADPRVCREYCEDEPNCEAFSYRRPIWQDHSDPDGGVTAKCFLKDDIPEQETDSGFISGVP